MTSALPTRPRALPDRHMWLIVFGILTAGMGLLLGITVPLMFFSAQAGSGFTGIEPDMRMLIPAAVSNGGLAIAMIWLGIGSMMSRRWARPLMLVFAWSWLVVGLTAIAITALQIPQLKEIFETAASSSGRSTMPEMGTTIVLTIMGVVFLLFFIVLPTIYILFYRSRSVEATCAARDPRPRWTDDVSLQVLGISIWLGIGAVGFALMPIAYRGVSPFFGRFVTGLAGWTVSLVTAVAWGYAAWAFYRRDIRGWWVLFVTLALISVSYTTTWFRHDMTEMYRMIGYPESQIAQMERFGTLRGTQAAWMTIIVTVPFLAYLIYARKFFRTEKTKP